MTYQEAAATALQVQDAVNLSGVVRSFSEATSAVWEEAHRTNKGTGWVNTHPIATLFLFKLRELNGDANTEGALALDKYREATILCEQIRAKTSIDPKGIMAIACAQARRAKKVIG